MARNVKSAFETGSHGAYLWLTADKQRLGSLLAVCPQTVLDKYLAITSLDSGPLVLNDEEVAAGWKSRNGIAYSPKVQSVDKLPHDGYDEWYVFQSPPDLGQLVQGDPPLRSGYVAAVVNFGGFSLCDPAMQALVDLFWMQLESVRPESFIADGDLLNFVSCDQELFAGVCAALR
jgi:hypothetical protein